MKKYFLFFLIFLLCFNFVSAVPELPMIINGSVTINDKPAKVGTEIIAKVNDQEINKVVISEKGKFTFLLQKLEDNSIVKLYVNDVDAEISVNYKSGDYKDLDLAIEKSYLIYYVIGGLIILGGLYLRWKKSKKLN